jgi:putative PIN family toxin of toxin-antitoxin system
MPSAVLDTNVLVSAFLFYERRGVPVELLHQARNARFTLVSSHALLDELEGVLTRDSETQERYGYTPEAVAAYRAILELQALLVEPKLIARVSRDVDDDLVIAVALAAEADYVVSGDNDLLTIGEHKGVRIVSPRQFLDLLERG